MSYELKVKNDKGEVLNLSTSPSYTVYKVTGLQPPQVSLFSSSNAATDGTTVSGVKAMQRNIVIYVAMEKNIESSRINLYKYFPLKKVITLYFKNGSRDVNIEGYVELIECDLFTNKQVAQISIICPQPYFKAAEELVSYFSDISSLFTFPFSIPADGIALSSITANIRKSIINTGDIESGIIIRLYAVGTVTNPVIYDVFERTHMKFNFTMQPNDEIIIDTNTGKKSVTLIRNGISTNLLGYMVADSTWLTLKAGDNVFTYDSDSGNSSLQVSFTTAILYGGV